MENATNQLVSFPLRHLPPNKSNHIFTKGTVSLHPVFSSFIEPGGELHLRMVSIDLKRAVIFKLYKNVNFPMDYEFLGSDVLSESRFDEIMGIDFYMEAFYMPPGVGYGGRPHCPGGEAWGRAGKLYPIKAGERADILISFFWTPALLKGKLSKPLNAVSSMWIDIKTELKQYISKDNIFTLYIKHTNKEDRNKPHLLAKKEIRNVDVDQFPMALHLLDEDFIGGYKKNSIGYFCAMIETENMQDKGSKIYIYGRRASSKVMIGIDVLSLRIPLFKTSSDHPRFL